MEDSQKAYAIDDHSTRLNPVMCCDPSELLYNQGIRLAGLATRSLWII